MDTTKYTKLVNRPKYDEINTGYSACRPSTLRVKFGNPRAKLGKDCQPVTGTKLKGLIVKGAWFGQPLYGLDSMIERLGRVEAAIRKALPELVPFMSHEGCLCARLVRGSKTSASNHSWGTAIDIAWNGQVDRRGDNKCQAWLLLVYPHFRKEGFYWGCEFQTEDSMHFELADETVKGLT